MEAELLIPMNPFIHLLHITELTLHLTYPFLEGNGIIIDALFINTKGWTSPKGNLNSFLQKKKEYLFYINQIKTGHCLNLDSDALGQLFSLVPGHGGLK